MEEGGGAKEEEMKGGQRKQVWWGKNEWGLEVVESSWMSGESVAKIRPYGFVFKHIHIDKYELYGWSTPADGHIEL